MNTPESADTPPEPKDPHTVNTPPHPADTHHATVADLVEHWNGVREHGPLAPATAATYLGSIARILQRQGITADTHLADLDLEALGEKFAAANPDLKPITLANYTNNLRSAISGYHARHHPAPASTTPFTPPTATQPAHPAAPANTPATAPRAGDLNGTLATLPAFLALAGRRGLLEQRTAQVYAATAHTILATQPDLAAGQVADLDPAAITATHASSHPALTDSTLNTFHTQLTHAVTAYLAYLQDPAAPEPEPIPEPGEPAQVHLPRGRVVSLAAPADMTDTEARAAAAVLRLHHPGMFTSDHPTPAPETPGTDGWTLVFWPEDNPDEPESAHITGPTFRAALADYIRTRHQHLAHLPDDDAINAWFATDVFFVHVIDGQHQARDAGTLL
jgi:hypothetical protein